LKFSDLPLDHRLHKALETKAFTEATEIQAKAIPHALFGKDLIASSKTGSGKTLAFLLPAIQRVLKQKPLSKRDPRVLILAPTRELAKQVFGELKKLIHGLPLKSTLVLGGENFNDQVKSLAKHPHFVVGTAGRIADHCKGKSLFLNGLELLIFDEADRMLDLGFSEQLNMVHGYADHRKRQTMMFSATLDNAQLHNFTQRLLRNPERIKVGDAYAEHTDIEQSFYFADHLDHKQALLEQMLSKTDYNQAIVFTATRDDAERLSELAKQWGIEAVSLHGEMKQAQRSIVMSEFSRNRYACLFTTDVASRGLDLSKISLVLNFDMPKHSDEYIHRVGRTGRAGNQGTAISLIGPKDWHSFVELRSYLKQEITFAVWPELEGKFKGLRPKKTSFVWPTDSTDTKAKTAAVKVPKPVRRVNLMKGKEAGFGAMKKRATPDYTDDIADTDTDSEE
jgi:superfamily II DNA/RNA helicase